MDELRNSCINCTKRGDSLLQDLSAGELKILSRNKYGVSYNKGEVICKEGTKPLGLICLNKGKVKIVRRGVNGTEQIVGLKKSVDFIGFRTLMSGINCLASFVALEDSSVCVINKKDFFEVVKTNKNLAFNIIKSLANELVKSDSRLVNLTQKHIRARLAEALLLIYDIYGINSNTGALNVSLKRSELASLANMTTSNAIRILSSFGKENLISINQRIIKLNDFNVLKKISELDYG